MKISYQMDFEFPDDATPEERQLFLSDIHQLVINLMPLLFEKHGLKNRWTRLFPKRRTCTDEEDQEPGRHD